jgi:hypothetical protein
MDWTLGALFQRELFKEARILYGYRRSLARNLSAMGPQYGTASA